MSFERIACSYDDCEWSHSSYAPSPNLLISEFTNHIADCHHNGEAFLVVPARPYFDDPLYQETVNRRITPPSPDRMADGPTARWADLEARRAAWALALEVGDDEEPTEAGAA